MGRLLEYFTHKYPYSDFHELNADWLISAYKELVAEVDDLDSWKATHEAEYEELKTFMDNINAGNFTPSMYEAMISWLENNAIDIVGEMVKHVYFGLNDLGYFVVTIPEQWADLVFKTTGFDYNTPLQPEFGHLCILY